MAPTKLNVEQTKSTLNMIFGLGAANGLEIIEEDKKTAAKLLNELIKRSCQMSLVEGIFRSEYSFSSSLQELVKTIAKTSFTNCSSAVLDGKYYDAVKVTLKRNWRSAFEIRKATGEW